MNSNLPSIALHSWHNASLSVYFSGDIILVIEFERFLNLKNASHDFFQPIHTQNYILKEISSYLSKEYGFTEYNKFIIGYGYSEFPPHYKDAFTCQEYIIDEGHHPSHAYGSLYQSPHNEAIIISFDGGSNDGFFNIYQAKKGSSLELLNSIGIDLGSHYHLLGSFCREVKNYNCLTAAGKVLGLQSYGKVKEEWKGPLRSFFSHVPHWHEIEERTSHLFSSIGLSNPTEGDALLEGADAFNLCRTGQAVFEDIFFENVDPFLKDSSLPIILTGGCSLNIVLNTRITERYSQEVFIAPNSSDCGLSVGLLCGHFHPTRIIDVTYKGIGVLDRYCLMEEVESRRGSESSLELMASDLFNNNIMGIIQGRSEHGPRALGNRSIICSPLSPGMKDSLNLKVKNREWFRPFAPIVRLEDVSEYFQWDKESRWMNFCPLLRPEYESALPAVTHIDRTARIQTITRKQNPLIYDLISAFKTYSGIGVLLNTSFNVDGKPIVSTYRDAFKVFDTTDLDRLYLDGYYFTK